MESLEGYSKVFQHSKYFQVEEDQICVDELGNVKIWVNADLSANYASSPDGYQEQKNKEEEIMVDAIISIIANNTDPQTEPSPSFKYLLFDLDSFINKEEVLEENLLKKQEFQFLAMRDFMIQKYLLDLKLF